MVERHVAFVIRAAPALLRVSELLHGLVVAVGRNAAWVALDGETEPRVADMRRSAGKRSMPVPGDGVRVRVHDEHRLVIDTVDERRFVLERHSLDGRHKIMAANVDLLASVTSFANPPPRLITLDQLLAFAEISGIEPLVIWTKPDLVGPESQAPVALYARLGYRCVICDPKHESGIEALRGALAGRRTLLAGVSGVGKSSIFRRLGGEGPVGDLSRTGMGRQTTTTARLVRLDDGFLIDSPGVNEFGLGRINPRDLAVGFREFAEPSTTCRFADCTHLVEPSCGVRAALETGHIAASRYDSFRSIQSPEGDPGKPE